MRRAPTSPNRHRVPPHPRGCVRYCPPLRSDRIRLAAMLVGTVVVLVAAHARADDPDRMAVEAIVIEQGFSGASVDRHGAGWSGQGARDGYLQHFVVSDRDLRVTSTRDLGDGPIADRR